MKLFKSAPDVPSLESVSPEVTELRKTRARLTSERAELVAKVAALRARAANASDLTRNSNIAAIISGGDYNSAEDSEQKLFQHLRRIEDTNQAIDVVAIQLSLAENRASPKVCDAVRAQYKAVVEQISRKLIEVHALNLQVHGLLDAVTDRGASTGSLPQIPGRILEHPRDRDSALGYYVREAAEAGFIDATEIPAEFR